MTTFFTALAVLCLTFNLPLLLFRLSKYNNAYSSVYATFTNRKLMLVIPDGDDQIGIQLELIDLLLPTFVVEYKIHKAIGENRND